jgi:hypothetical protein
VLSGEQGSAKSTFSAILRALLDPHTAPLRALPREDRMCAALPAAAALRYACQRATRQVKGQSAGARRPLALGSDFPAQDWHQDRLRA